MHTASNVSTSNQPATGLSSASWGSTSRPASLLACLHNRCLAALLVAACMLAPCAAQSALSVLNPNFKKPTHINNYAEYIRYAGQALGYLPVEPEADAPAPGPGAAMAPNSAPAGPLCIDAALCWLSVMSPVACACACCCCRARLRPQSTSPELHWRS